MDKVKKYAMLAFDVLGIFCVATIVCFAMLGLAVGVVAGVGSVFALNTLQALLACSAALGAVLVGVVVYRGDVEDGDLEDDLEF